ncbi:MAG: helix-turn-helix domain-containing protein [Actinophytocola sp.]|nr:helix-turn-helix domain-containing protein [Actinophytocola sp.]
MTGPEAKSNSTGNEGGTGGPTACRIILGAQLRRLREQAGISRSEAGYSIRSSESKISRLELGRVGFKERDVADLLTMYGVYDERARESLLRLVAQSKEAGWWRRYNDLLPYWFSEYVGLEESASRIQTFELQYVPGLLQTEDYARAVASHGQPGATEEKRRRTELRMRRQKILTHPGAPRLWTVIDESALRRPIGGSAVMRAQLDALLEWTTMPHIALQVLPYERSGHAAEGAFTILRFAEPEIPDIVYIEYLVGALYLDKLDEIERYSRAMDRLAVDAESISRSRELIKKIRAEI